MFLSMGWHQTRSPSDGLGLPNGIVSYCTCELWRRPWRPMLV
jgi:hypothetical protein